MATIERSVKVFSSFFGGWKGGLSDFYWCSVNSWVQNFLVFLWRLGRSWVNFIDSRNETIEKKTP